MQHKAFAVGLAMKMQEGCVGTRVGRLHRLVDRRFEQHLRPLGLSVPQMEVLSALTLIAQPVKPSALADALNVERSTMSRNLAAMQERGWVAPGDVSATGRSMTIVITEDGTAKLGSAESAWEAAQASLVAALGADASGTLDSWLQELAS